MPTQVINSDTIKLLRECSAGAKMGVESIDEVLESVQNEDLKNILSGSKSRHEAIARETDSLLEGYHDDGKEPGMMAKGMSWLKTNFKLTVDSSDETIADLITDGCNMGTKSLRRYINEYAAADEKAKDITYRLITAEEDTIDAVKQYL